MRGDSIRRIIILLASLMPSAVRSVYFHPFLSTDYVTVFQLQHKESLVRHSLLPRLPPGIERKRGNFCPTSFSALF